MPNQSLEIITIHRSPGKILKPQHDCHLKANNEFADDKQEILPEYKYVFTLCGDCM